MLNTNYLYTAFYRHTSPSCKVQSIQLKAEPTHPLTERTQTICITQGASLSWDCPLDSGQQCCCRDINISSMALSCAESYITKTSVYELQTVCNLHIHRLTTSLLTILPTDCSFYNEDTGSRFLLTLVNFYQTIPSHSTVLFAETIRTFSYRPQRVWGKALPLMIDICLASWRNRFLWRDKPSATPQYDCSVPASCDKCDLIHRNSNIQ